MIFCTIFLIRRVIKLKVKKVKRLIVWSGVSNLQIVIIYKLGGSRSLIVTIRSEKLRVCLIFFFFRSGLDRFTGGRTTNWWEDVVSNFR